MAKSPDQNFDEFLALAGLALAGKPQDVQMFLARTVGKYNATQPALTQKIAALVAAAQATNTRLPGGAPTDRDSRLSLVRSEQPTFKSPPIFVPSVAAQIDSIIRERQNIERLRQAEIEPTRTALFTGPPGVGKTLTARWIAAQLGLPLLTLDLAAVMSSFLGRTGNNVRAVLDYAKRQNCVLLLDELDAVAKRRDDTTEIGELKRLVTVLLQEIDEWPSSGVLLAATNHPELLDPAVWRRFDNVIEFPKPAMAQVVLAVKAYLGPDAGACDTLMPLLAGVFADRSFSDIQRAITNIRRRVILNDTSIEDEVVKHVGEWTEGLSQSERVAFARRLYATGLSQRRTSEITGVSRDTLRTRDKRSTS